MPGEVQVRKGAILLWRLGTIEYGDQSRWSRAPKSRGMWAFPFPYADSFFFYHQWVDRLPKRLRYRDRSNFPISREWYAVGEYGAVERELLPTEPLVWPEPDEDGRIGCPTSVDVDGNELELTTKDGMYDERERWINTVGKRILPIRKFWYEGDLYSHINERGEIGNVGIFGEKTDWNLIHSTTFARVIEKNRGTRGYSRTENGLAPFNWSMDHLEVFLPAGAGRITSPREISGR